jgi:hypothetical protein
MATIEDLLRWADANGVSRDTELQDIDGNSATGFTHENEPGAGEFVTIDFEE